jgi:hypothetical protein
LIKTICAFKAVLICFFYAKYKNNRAGVSKGILKIGYCVLYITKVFISKVELIIKV